MSSIRLEIKIEGNRIEVWNTFFAEAEKWWPSDGHTSPKTKLFLIEEKLGGKMYEDFGNNEGLIWADVIGLDKPSKVILRGQLSPEFGGPAISFLQIEFKAEGTGTQMIVTDSYLGPNAEKNAAGVEQGWKSIFGESFKNYFESKK